MSRKRLVGLAAVFTALSCAAAAQAPPAAPSPWSIAATAQSSYDSNLLQDNQQTIAGWEQELNGLLQWQQLSPTHRLQLQYRPAMQIVTAYPGLNSFNQTAVANLRMKPSPRWTLGGSADGSYLERMPTTGVGSVTGLAGVAPLPLLPRTRAVSGDAQLQLGYAMSARSSLQAFGEFTERRFPGAGVWAQTLRGVKGENSGLRYSFTATPRTTWGLELDQQNFGIGHDAHLAAASLLLHFQHDFTPVTSVQFSGGPEYSQVHETDQLHLNIGGLPLTLTDRFYRVRTYPRLTASITHQGRGWPWRLTLGQQISNGGGALPFPTSLFTASGSIARQISPQWRAQFGLNASQFNALDGGADLVGHVRLAAIDAALARRLGRQLSLEFDYEYFLQRSSGLMPLAPALNRSLGGIRLRWQWPPLPEGGV
ncbi:MAG: hypothetical protein EPN33_09935 [Acidobacteria bacterium]|nr:MAG: hypothetical protein EPN33_09935 [Acidobacteriota bacterium]